MPCQRKSLERGPVEARNSEARQDTLKISAVERIKLAERNVPSAHFFQGWLVLAAPSIPEGKPVEVVSKRLEDFHGLACDTSSPVYQSTEHVEEECFDGHVPTQ